jgi:hypothetical protein
MAKKHCWSAIVAVAAVETGSGSVGAGRGMVRLGLRQRNRGQNEVQSLDGEFESGYETAPDFDQVQTDRMSEGMGHGCRQSQTEHQIQLVELEAGDGSGLRKHLRLQSSGCRCQRGLGAGE